MSDENNNEVVNTCCCAACGVAEIDEIKLTECDGCDLVRYCGDDCREDHKSEHEEDCKKRAAELRDKLLFKQPESSHLGDCPICTLPLPYDLMKSESLECCGKVICNGCSIANQIREWEMRLQQKCPFCRKVRPETKEEMEKQHMKRVEANDPVAIFHQGWEQFKKEDYISVFEYWTKAAELGYVEARYHLAIMYHNGYGVEKDVGKKIHLLEEAAIAGHPEARYNLACEEWTVGKKERAVKHWIIAAAQGQDDAVKDLIDAFKRGVMAKEDLAASFRAHKAAVDATKSRQRQAAENILSTSKPSKEYDDSIKKLRMHSKRDL